MREIRKTDAVLHKSREAATGMKEKTKSKICEAKKEKDKLFKGSKQKCVLTYSLQELLRGKRNAQR